MAAVHLERLRKAFPTPRGSVRAVDELTLAAEDRELLVLVGPSGCGKTTTLRMVAGLEQPTAGRIEIDGRDVSSVPPRDRDIAMVFQHDSLYPHMNVFRNIAFGLKMRRVDKGEIRRRVDEAAGLLGLQDLLERKPAALSGGERRRVALGRAVVRRPNVFLLDEPLSNLDAVLRLQMRTEIKLLQRRLATTMIYVTHDQEEAMTLGDRIAVMRGGALLQCGPPLEVYDCPANRFVAGFIGTPPMNFLRGRLRGQGPGRRFESADIGLSWPSGDQATDAAMAVGEVFLGIRPQHVRIVDRSQPGPERSTSPGHSSPHSKGGLRGVASAAEAGSPGDAPKSDTTPFQAPACLSNLELQSIEALGDRTYAHLATKDGAAITALVPAMTPASIGKHFDALVDLSRVHLFAADEDGKRLG